VELMVVVAMVGILATLGLVGYRKFINQAKSAEAKSLVSSIRSAEESYRAETMSYFNASLNGYYPRTSFDSKKMSWTNPAHADVDRWKTLGVVADGPVRFGYKVNAGNAGQAVTSVVTIDTPGVTFPTPTEPWYVVQARGNVDEEGTDTFVLTSSFTNEVAIIND
jgi:type IV pilus assembly protein PilA